MRAWSIILAGIASLVACVILQGRIDERAVATLATVPWHVLQLFAIGVVLVLVGAHSDSSVYSGKKGFKKLIRTPWAGIGFVVIVSHLVAMVAIGFGLALGKALQYSIFAPLILGALGDLLRRKRK